MRQPSAYYSAFSYTAPRDCNECPSCEHLDEEDANDIATFFCAGMANRVAIEKRIEHERAVMFASQRIGNLVLGFVMGAEGVR